MGLQSHQNGSIDLIRRFDAHLRSIEIHPGNKEYNRKFVFRNRNQRAPVAVGQAICESCRIFDNRLENRLAFEGVFHHKFQLMRFSCHQIKWKNEQGHTINVQYSAHTVYF